MLDFWRKERKWGVISDCCVKPLSLPALAQQQKTNAVTKSGYLEVELTWEKSHFSYNKS